jgi:hypothetical protein
MFTTILESNSKITYGRGPNPNMRSFYLENLQQLVDSRELDKESQN